MQRLLTVWYPLWTLLFQPAIGVLMLGAVSLCAHLPTVRQYAPFVCAWTAVQSEFLRGFTMSLHLHLHCFDGDLPHLRCWNHNSADQARRTSSENDFANWRGKQTAS